METSRSLFLCLLAVVSFISIPLAVCAHIENADLFDFASEYAFQQVEGNEPEFPTTPGRPEIPKNDRGQPAASGEIGSLSRMVGDFGTITVRESRVSFWVRLSDWVVSRFGVDGPYRWTRVFRTERKGDNAAGSFSLDSFNGVYLTAIAEGEREIPGLAVRSSGPGVESVVFLGHPSRLMAGTFPDLPELDLLTVIVSGDSFDEEFAAHVALVVRNVGY